MVQAIVDKEQLLRLIRYDCETFFSFYLGEALTLDVPDFHKEIWDELLAILEQVNRPDQLTGILKKLLGVPRGHAKTTIIKLAMVLFLRYSRFSFLAYISNTYQFALNAVKDIFDWFKSSQDQELYGQISVEKSSESVGEFIFYIRTPLADRPKLVIMKAFGVNTQIRGSVIKNRRPDLMVFDDCESVDTAANKVQQAKLDTWCLGTAMKSMAREGFCVFIGNMIADTTLLARLAQDPEWLPTVFGCIIRDSNGELRPLWDGLHTLDGLLDDYGSYRRVGNGHTWEAELMNLTAKDIFGESLEEAIRPVTPLPDDVEGGFICLDPAFGEKAYNDLSALTVHVMIRDQPIPVIVDSWEGRVREEALLDELIRLSLRWGITTWAIESVAAQKLLISVFRLLLVNRGMSPESFLMLPILAGRESKASRIVAFRAAVAKQSYAIAESEETLFRRLEEYTPGVDHDDLEDSASYGILVWNLYGNLVKARGREDIAGVIFGSNQLPVLTGTDMGV